MSIYTNFCYFDPTNSHLIYTWSLKLNPFTVQANYLSNDELLILNSDMGTHYQVRTTRHNQLILDHRQTDTQQLSLRHEKEEVYPVQLSYPFIYPEHQDAFNSILVTTWSDGLFKAPFWNLLVHRIVYPYFGRPNSNNQVIFFKQSYSTYRYYSGS